MGVWCSRHHDPQEMIERDPEREGYFVMLKPMPVTGTKSAVGEARSRRFYVDPEEHPELARDLDEFAERYEQTVERS